MIVYSKLNFLLPKITIDGSLLLWSVVRVVDDKPVGYVQYFNTKTGTLVLRGMAQFDPGINSPYAEIQSSLYVWRIYNASHQVKLKLINVSTGLFFEESESDWLEKLITDYQDSLAPGDLFAET